MRYLLMTHASPAEWERLGSAWTRDDLRRMVDFMRTLDRGLRESGELVDENGFGGPSAAKTVRAAEDGTPQVTDGLRGADADFLVGYWLVDVASPERAYEIATQISATPGPGGVPIGQAVEVHPVAAPPETG